VNHKNGLNHFKENNLGVSKFLLYISEESEASLFTELEMEPWSLVAFKRTTDARLFLLKEVENL
jgi:hypothetical protein